VARAHGVDPARRLRDDGSTVRSEAAIGQGGFGQVYLAKRLGRSTLVPDIVFRRRHPWGCPYGAALIDIDRALTLLLS
jgi:hypothetical protein